MSTFNKLWRGSKWDFTGKTERVCGILIDGKYGSKAIEIAPNCIIPLGNNIKEECLLIGQRYDVTIAELIHYTITWDGTALPDTEKSIWRVTEINF